jgi:alpha-beta hydrolase superfamily lysophospholipase
MGYTCEKITYPSSDGKNTVSAKIFVPDCEIKGIVTLAHGMRDYVGRYVDFAAFLCEEGYVFAGNDHLGHGETASCSEDMGYFAPKDGYLFVIDDLLSMNRIVRERFPNLPIVMMGHSMGSFLARLYAEKYPDTVDGLIIHGTGGRNPLLGVGKLLISLIRAIRGDRHRSGLVSAMAFGSYNKGFDTSESDEPWLTRDSSRISSRPTDPYCAFKFTAAGYADLFSMIGLSNSDAHFSAYPKSLPTLVVSGEADPVGDYGRGVRFVYERLKESGVKKVDLLLYPDARHELFNETNRDEVMSDISAWLSEVIER